MKGRKGVRVGNKTHPHAGDGKMPAFSNAPSSKGSVPAPPSAPILGKRSAMRLDRPGRKRGGACGSELSPLSMAAKSN